MEVTGAGTLLTLSGLTPTVPTPSPSALSIGLGAGNRGNALYVSAGAVVQVTGTNDNHMTHVGASNGAGLGGNTLEVAAGGTFTTVGSTAINSYQSLVGNAGSNQLMIRDQGAFSVNSDIRRSISSHGLIQIDEGGELTGNTDIFIEATGVLRAAGSGLNIDGAITVRSGGLVEIGSSDTEGEVFTLTGDITMEENSRMRFSLIGAGDYDQLDLITDSTLTLVDGVLLEFDLGLGYLHEAGTVYTLFTGDISGINGQFDITGFDSTLWDFNRFNQAGGWQVVAIPEPSSMVLGVGGALLLLAGVRRRGGARRKVGTLVEKI